jgi:hypothetical protein
MPEPGEPVPNSVFADSNRCWRMVYDHNLQASHCRSAVEWHGRRFAPLGERWWRVAACVAHTDGLTGLSAYRFFRPEVPSPPERRRGQGSGHFVTVTSTAAAKWVPKTEVYAVR